MILILVKTQGGHSGKTTEIKLGVRLAKDYDAGSEVTQQNAEKVQTYYYYYSDFPMEDPTYKEWKGYFDVPELF